MKNNDDVVLSMWLEYLNTLNINSTSIMPLLEHAPESTLAITGLKENLYNSIFINQPDNYNQLLTELRQLKQKLGIPLTAWVTPYNQSPELEALFKNNFPTPGSFHGMVLDIAKAKITLSPKEIIIEKVINSQQAVEFAQIFVSIFNFPNLLEQTIIWATKQFEEKEPSGFSYIAKVNGKAAGVCSLLFNRTFKPYKTGGLYNACVLPQFRQLGIGTAMACHRINVAKQMGLEILSILLMSTGMARSYCERLGFTHQLVITPYYIT